MNQTRKKITLPSGATCVIRKLAAKDLATYCGDVPVFAPELTGRTPKAEAPADPKLVAQGVAYMTVALLCCCSPLTLEDGRKLKIVEKPLDEAADSEITIGELDDADAKAIFDGVVELSGIVVPESGKEAAKAAVPFPAEQKIPEELGFHGQSLPPSTEQPLAVNG